MAPRATAAAGLWVSTGAWPPPGQAWIALRAGHVLTVSEFSRWTLMRATAQNLFTAGRSSTVPPVSNPRRALALTVVLIAASPSTALGQSGAGTTQAQGAPSSSGTALTPGPPTSGRSSRPKHRPRSRHPRGSNRGAGPARSSATARGGRGLPSTGYEVPTVALLGTGLLACGLGLRMRTIDVRRF